MQCLVRSTHDCAALDMYFDGTHSNPIPCKTCNMKRVVELEEKIKADEENRMEEEKNEKLDDAISYVKWLLDNLDRSNKEASNLLLSVIGYLVVLKTR